MSTRLVRNRVLQLIVLPAVLCLPPPAPAQSDPSDRSVPVGSSVTVRTIDRIDSKSAEVGQTFRASLDEPIVANGKTLAPKSSDAVLRLVESRSAGRLKGSAGLTVMLVSVNSGGQTLAINSDNVSVESGGKGKKSALKVGGGAAAGAVLGGVFGGRRGAAIGAGAGAGAGAAAAMATGPRVQIQPETRLTFTVQ